jgi:hypothetical protein
MIPTEYKIDREKNQLILKEEAYPKEGYFLKLIENGVVDGILPLERRKIDEKTEYYWDGTGKQSLKSFLEEGSIDTEELKDILEKLWEVIKRGESYLLKSEDYILSEDAIFIDTTDFSVFLCYLPGRTVDAKKQWHSFTEYLMNVADHRKEDMVLYVYSLYRGARQPNGVTESLIHGMERRWKKEIKTEEREAITEQDRVSKPLPSSYPVFQEEREENDGVMQPVPMVQQAWKEFMGRIESEEIEEAYPKKFYWIAAAFGLIGAVAGILGLVLWHPEPLQAGGYLLIICALCVYGISRVFSPQNKEARIEREVGLITTGAKGQKIFEWERQE